MKRRFLAFVVMLLTFIFSGTALAAIPGISGNRYIKMFGLSTANNTPVYTNARLDQRGTASPFKAYNATVYASDEIYVLAMNDNYALISYPVSNGRRQGYVSTSSLTSNNFSKGAMKSRRQITTYRRPGSTSYGYISNGDDVWTVARQGDYTQVVYPTGNTYKMAWISNSDYNNYIDSGSSSMKGDVNNDGRIDEADVKLLASYQVGSISTLPNMSNADMDNDGQITLSDIVALRQFLAKNSGNVNHNPQGKFESYGTLPNMLRVMGYAYDADDMNSKTRIHVYIDGTAGNSNVPSYEIRANKSHNSYPGHGFDETVNVPDQWCGKRTVHVYALNDAGPGTYQEIGSMVIDIPSNAPRAELLYPLKGRSIEWSSNVTTNGQRCDYIAPSGTPLYAPADGTVQFRQSYAVNYGKLASYGNNIIFVSSDGKYEVKCAHLSRFNGVSLRYNDTLKYPCSASKYSCKTVTLASRNVKQGDLIGYTGMTGNASGPHVHIEVKRNGTPVNPKDVFTTW